MTEQTKADIVLSKLIDKAKASDTMVDSASAVFSDQENLTSELMVAAVGKIYRGLVRRIIQSDQVSSELKNSLIDFDMIGFPQKYQIFESIDSVSVEIHDPDDCIRITITLVLSSSRTRVYITELPRLPIIGDTELLPPPLPPTPPPSSSLTTTED